MENELKKGLYRHYKGMNYIVHNIVSHSETLEELVLYESLNDSDESKKIFLRIKLAYEHIKDYRKNE